jgi:ribosome-associated protein
MKRIRRLTDLHATGESKPRARARTKKAAAPASPAAAEDSVVALKDLILAALDDGKAEELIAIDLAGKTSLADWMVVASGRSNTQVAALADRLARAIKESGRPAPGIEGLPQADWVLIDAGDVIAHVFRPEVRQFYNLEKMWGGARPSEPSHPSPEKPAAADVAGSAKPTSVRKASPKKAPVKKASNVADAPAKSRAPKASAAKPSPAKRAPKEASKTAPKRTTKSAPSQD